MKNIIGFFVICIGLVSILLMGVFSIPNAEARVDGNTITLDKYNDNWIVNNKFKVRSDAISTILSTIKKIRQDDREASKKFRKVLSPTTKLVF